jgi:hypothetical protein
MTRDTGRVALVRLITAGVRLAVDLGGLRETETRSSMGTSISGDTISPGSD